jgi:hypothetical protein
MKIVLELGDLYDTTNSEGDIEPGFLTLMKEQKEWLINTATLNSGTLKSECVDNTYNAEGIICLFDKIGDTLVDEYGIPEKDVFILSSDYNDEEIQERLNYLRGEIKAENISYEEVAELQSLSKYIDPSDVELLEWAGVEERINSCK